MLFCRFFTLVMLLPLWGQAQPGNCKQYVLSAYQQFARRYDFGGASPVAHLKMLVETTYHQQAKRTRPRPTKQLIEAERQGGFLHFTDGTTEAYQSPGELVTIMRDKKIVAITNADMPKQPEFAPGLQLIRTYIIEHAPIESCGIIKEANGRTYQRVVFLAQSVAQKVPQLTGIQKLTVIIDEKTKAIFRFNMLYETNHPLSQVTYTLLEEAPVASGRRLKAAFEYVLTPSSMLRTEFSGFKLLDQRKR